MLDSRMPNSQEIQGYLEDKSGLDLEPHPITEKRQRIASHGAEFAGGFGPFGLASKGNLALKGHGSC